MSVAVRVAGLLVLSAVGAAWGQAPADKPASANWTILFRSDNPALWDTDAKANGEQIAIPVKFAPAAVRYLRLRRMDTWDELILPITRDQLLNGKPRDREAAAWWSGTAKHEWGGRHLGIAQLPRHKFPAPKGLIDVMNDGWDCFVGSGFGHKYGVGDRQYYCWRGEEIARTAFEIAVTDGPLGPEEKRNLISGP